MKILTILNAVETIEHLDTKREYHLMLYVKTLDNSDEDKPHYLGIYLKHMIEEIGNQT